MITLRCENTKTQERNFDFDVGLDFIWDVDRRFELTLALFQDFDCGCDRYLRYQKMLHITL